MKYTAFFSSFKLEMAPRKRAKLEPESSAPVAEKMDEVQTLDSNDSAAPISMAPTSRLIVKGLPNHTTEARLRKVFEAKGTITDIRLMFTRNGRFRQFAFVGYTTVEEAEQAKRFFDRTFFDTHRMTVEFATSKLDDPSSVPVRPWSIYSKGSSRHDEYERRKENERRAQAGVPSLEEEEEQKRQKDREERKLRRRQESVMVPSLNLS